MVYEDLTGDPSGPVGPWGPGAPVSPYQKKRRNKYKLFKLTRKGFKIGLSRVVWKLFLKLRERLISCISKNQTHKQTKCSSFNVPIPWQSRPLNKVEGRIKNYNFIAKYAKTHWGLVIKQIKNKIKLRETSKAKQNSYFSSVKHKTRMSKLTCIGGSDATRLVYSIISENNTTVYNNSWS